MRIQHQFEIVLLRVAKVLTAVLTVFIFAPQLSAAEMSHGEMAGIIRSAGEPCKKVLNMQSSGENSWKVECNSGTFTVTRDADGKTTVTP